MMDFSKFDNAVDLAGLQKDIEDAASGNIERVEVPHGTYEVKVDKIELKESKKGDPMVSMWFKIIAGEFERNIIFLNQVITRGFQIHIVNEILRSMRTELPITFESFSQYGALLEDVFGEIDGKKEFALEYGENDKGYNTFKIVDVFNVKN